ncbi:MAG: nucleotidyltransferase family protein, partial [Bacteroidales bacterium]|nr:nucleotidyltransferase family protein [Bacteroidales bacterium]
KTILAALKQMDNTGRKLLLVFDGNRFESLLSIGDIQRAIIKNISLETPVDQILRQNIRVAGSDESLDEIKARMIRYRTECMPVLEKDGALKDVSFWEDLFRPGEKMVKADLGLPVVIMAGGEGKRLKPLTNILPKPLFPIGDKTIIERIMEKFEEVGCNEFFVSVNYKAEMVKFYLKQQKKDTADLVYLHEDKPLGTAGSLFLLKEKINRTFFVSNCDIIVDQDYSEIYNFHVENKNEITIVAALKHLQIAYGTLETGENGKLLKLIEKPDLTFKINSGLYILEPHLLSEIPENTFFHITDLIANVLERKGRVGVFPVSEKSWKDIGEWKEFLKNFGNIEA